MAVIEFDGLSVQDAEEVIAEIWTCLEQYAIPSPKLRVHVHNGTEVTVHFRFSEAIWADVVSARIGKGYLVPAHRIGQMCLSRGMPMRSPRRFAARQTTDELFQAARRKTQ
jgi:hypothetical protein